MIFNPSRLSLARKRRMLNKKQLADAIQVAPMTITRWEKRESAPTAENLTACARALEFPSAFFYGPDLDEPNIESTSFRSQKAMTAAMRDAAHAAGAIAFLIVDWIEQRFDLPEVKLPDLHLFGPEEAARALRQEWALGEKPISNMIQLLESKGVRVFSLAQNTARLNAYAHWRNEKPYVFLNTFMSAERSRFDAAHELAHLVLHQDGAVKGRAAEDQAQAFASAFLMPRSAVLSVLPRVTYIDQLVREKARWKVSVAALNHRVHKLGITSEWKHRDLCIEIMTRKYHRNEPNSIDREKSVLWEKVLKALWTEQITPSDIASQLHIPASELGDLLLFMVGGSTPTTFGSSVANLSVVVTEGDEFGSAAHS